MKQQTKKEFWYWMITGMAILILLALAYSSKGGKKKKSPTKKEAVQEATTAKKSSSNTKDSSQPKGGGQEPEYYRELSGGQIGQSYLLTDSKVKDYSTDSRLVIYLSPTSATQLPRYVASLQNKVIGLTLSDTSDFDFTGGGKVYKGDYSITGKGMIKGVKVLRLSGSQMKYNISLTKDIPFRAEKETKPLRLIIKVPK